jgi:Concanavalin A-like lectin/glucanases superfamily
VRKDGCRLQAASAPSLNITNQITIEGWFKLAITSQYQDFFSKDDGTHYDYSCYIRITNKICMWTDNFGEVCSTATITDSNWHHLVFTRDGSNTASIYIDGNLSTFGTMTGVFPSNNVPLNIGNEGVMPSPDFRGTLDELRLSNIARSASWIQTEYNNESSPSTFYNMFPEETQATSGQVLMANSGTVTNATGRVKYRLSAGSAQPAGTYTTMITYTIYAAY